VVCSLPHTLSSTSCSAHAHISCRGHRPLVVCPLPHTLSHLLAVVLMRSSAIVGIGLLWSALSPSHTLSSTSSGAHALICCRGHLPLVVTPSPHSFSSTSSGAHALICCRGHRPLEVCPLPHTLSHLPAVVLMRSSAIVGILHSWSAPSLTHSLIYQPWCSCAHLLSWASSSRGLLPPTRTLIY